MTGDVIINTRQIEASAYVIQSYKSKNKQVTREKQTKKIVLKV